MKKLIAVALATMLLIGSMGGAMAVAFDTETTTTGTQSDVSSSSTSQTWQPGNTAATLYVETDNASANASAYQMELRDQDTGEVYLTNSSAETVNDSNGHYAFNESHSSIRSSLPSDPQGTQFTVAVVNTNTGKDVLTQDFSLNYETTGTARYYVSSLSGNDSAYGAGLVAHGLDVSEKKTWFGFGSNYTVATFSDVAALNSSNTTLQYQMTDSDTISAYDSAAEGVESGKWMQSTTLTVGTDVAKIYKKEAPDSASGNYGVYNPSTDRLTVYRSDDYAGAAELEISSGAGESYSFGDALSAFGFMDALAAAI